MSYFKPYKYVKDYSNDPFYKVVNRRFAIVSAGPLILTALGVFFMVTQIVLPLVSFKTQPEISKPIESSVLGLASGFKDFTFDELDSGLGSSSSSLGSIPEFYYLTVPKLGIERALVSSMPEDLDPDDSLGHYVGSAYPGEAGNTFIYGHSVLPSFYNPRNYKTIFSTLNSLQVGDSFSIEYNNVKYNYKIEQKRNLYPDEVNPLMGYKPAYLNESTVSLMTCSPAGTKIKRLLIDATLVD